MNRIKLPGWQTAKGLHIHGRLLPHPERGIVARPEPRNTPYRVGQVVAVEVDGERVVGQVWSQAPDRRTGRESGRCAWLVANGHAYLLDPDTCRVYLGLYDSSPHGLILAERALIA
jgi:hypothetical protein